MVDLAEKLLQPQYRPQTVQTLTEVVETEVNSKSGLSGTAIKTAYKGAQKISPNIVSQAMDKMLEDFLHTLDPFWRGRGEQPFGAYLAANSDQVTEELLKITDARAAKPDNAAAAKVYGMLRGKAKENVTPALPRLGSALEGLMNQA